MLAAGGWVATIVYRVCHVYRLLGDGAATILYRVCHACRLLGGGVATIVYRVYHVYRLLGGGVPVGADTGRPALGAHRLPAGDRMPLRAVPHRPSQAGDPAVTQGQGRQETRGDAIHRLRPFYFSLPQLHHVSTSKPSAGDNPPERGRRSVRTQGQAKMAT